MNATTSGHTLTDSGRLLLAFKADVGLGNGRGVVR